MEAVGALGEWADLSGFLHRGQLYQIWLGSNREVKRAGKRNSRDRLAGPPAGAAALKGPLSPPRAPRSLPVGSAAAGCEHRAWQGGGLAPPPAACMRLPGFGEWGGEARPGSGVARRAWEDGGRGREKQSANLQVLHRRTGREGGHAATGRRETEITTTSRGAHAAGGRGAASGVTPARSGAGRSKPGLSGAEQWRSLWEASSLLGKRGAQGPGLPGPSGAPAQDQVGKTGPDSSPLHCSETQFGALSGTRWD